ncbi:MAG: hypothetical protein ACI9SP_004559 [Arenicella sp.]|jgi:hypothetical protein
MNILMQDTKTVALFNNEEKIDYGLTEFLFSRPPVFAGESDVVNVKDVITNEPDMADFNSECLKATVVATGEQMDALFIKLPLISQKEVIQPCNLKDQSFFDASGNEIKSIGGKYLAKKAKIMIAGRTRVNKRREFMVGELLKSGKMVIDGENINATEIDFGINHTVTLTAADLWTAGTSKPSEQLEAMESVVNKGAADSNDVHVIHTPLTWAAYRKHQEFKDWKKERINTKDYGKIIFDKTKPRGLTYKMEDSDGHKHWLYTEPTGGLVDGFIYVVNRRKFSGIPVFGRIVTDVDGSSTATNILFTSRKQDDPVGEEVQYQSKPLLVGNLDAVVSSQVVSIVVLD